MCVSSTMRELRPERSPPKTRASLPARCVVLKNNESETTWVSKVLHALLTCAVLCMCLGTPENISRYFEIGRLFKL